MSASIELFPYPNADSARITLTEEYMVVNGSYLLLSNGFAYDKKGALAIKAKDILCIDRQKLRNKRLLVVGLTLFGVLLLMNTIFGWVGKGLSYQKAIAGDSAAQMELLAETFGVAKYVGNNYFAEMYKGNILEWDEYALLAATMDKAVDLQSSYEKYTALYEGKYEKVSAFSVLKTIAGVIFLGGATFCVGLYVLRPIAVLHVKAMGSDFAVQVKYYDRSDVERMERQWQSCLP